jgi:hypothetical protein
MAPGIGAYSTGLAGNMIKDTKLFNAYNELYPSVADKNTGEQTVKFDTIRKAHKTLHDTFNQLRNDDTRMGKINYLIAKHLLKRPTGSAQSNLDLLQKIKSNPDLAPHFMGTAQKYVLNTSDMYSIMKNPKLNALGYGMSKAFPLYTKYLLAKYLYRYGKKGFGFLKKKITDKKGQPMLMNETESPT